MGGKGGKKRKKNKNSPNSQSDQENKRIMASYKCMPTSPMQGMQTQSGLNSYIMSPSFQYQPAMFGGSQMPGMSGNMTQPTSPGTADQSTMGLILQKLESMDKKLGQLDNIQKAVSKITVQVSDIEKKVNVLETKVNEIESSRQFDSGTLDNINKKQKEVDSMISKLKKAEQEAKENDLNAKILDMQCRSMRDNLMFYKIPEERNETDDDCEEKVLNLIEEDLEIPNAKAEMKLHTAHRIGRYNPTKIRPIVVKFAYYPDREKVRKNANKLKGKAQGISQQFPKEIMDKRKKLVPIMKQARENGQDAYINVDKLYINNELYKGPNA